MLDLFWTIFVGWMDLTNGFIQQITSVPLLHPHVLQELCVKKAEGGPISCVGSNSTGCRRKMQLGLILNWTLACTIPTLTAIHAQRLQNVDNQNVVGTNLSTDIALPSHCL